MLKETMPLNAFGERQQELLQLLQRNKSGLTIEVLSDKLQISRTAVCQHIAALERAGYVKKGVAYKTGGRPSQAYLLTESGIGLFPKQYSWFSALLLKVLKKERGGDGAAKALLEAADETAETLMPRMEGKSSDQRIDETVKIVNELGSDARRIPGQQTIEASNCVYHQLATDHPEVCQFDIKILEKLTGSSVEHVECMAKGGNTCRFKLSHHKAKKG